MTEQDPPSLDDLKKFRTNAKRAVTLQMSFIKKIIAEDKPDQRGRIVESRTTLIELFDSFEAAHHAYVNLLSDESDPESELVKCEDYLAAEQDIYSTFLEFVRDRLGIDDYRDVNVTRHVTEVVTTQVENDADGNPVPNQFSSLMESLNKPFAALVDSMNRPKVDLEKFSGSPAVYHDFIKRYDLAMGLCEDFGYKLTILNQFLSDEPRRDIKGCLKISDPKKGYENARKILDERYGDPCKIAHKIVENLRNGKPVHTASEIKRLSADLNDAELTLREINMLEKMMSQPIIREIVLRLPDHLCKKWQSFSVKKRLTEKSYPDFEALCEFVRGHSEILSDEIFGEKFLSDKTSQRGHASKSGRQEKLTNYSTSLVDSNDNQDNGQRVAHATQVGPQVGVSGKSSKSSQHGINSNSQPPICPLCNVNHMLYHCDKFKKLPAIERHQLVQANKLCFNCLREGHSSKYCRKESVCNVPNCGRKHSTWLHIHDNSSRSSNAAKSNANLNMSSRSPVVRNNPGHEQNRSQSASNQQTGLRNPAENRVDFSGLTVQDSTAEIDPSGNPGSGSMSAESGTQSQSNIRSASGMCTDKKDSMQYRRADGSYMPVVKVLVNGEYLTRVGLDTMSSDTLCTENFSRRVGLQQGPMLDSMTMATMTGSVEMKNTPTVSMTIESVDKMSGKIHLKNIPTVPCPIIINKAQNDVEQYEHLRDLVFSVPEAVNEVDIISGVDNSEVMCPLQVFKGKKGEPFATLTMFGMVLHGKKSVEPNSVNSNSLQSYVTALAPFSKPAVCTPDIESIHENLDRLWAMDSDVTPSQVNPMKADISTGKKGWSQEDHAVMKMWDKETVKVGKHYQIPIPVRNPAEKLPNNYVVAESMVQSLIKRLKREGKYEKYDEDVKTLIKEGYAQIIPENEINEGNPNYLSHHYVVIPKWRVVFNLKLKYKGKSLNDRCMQGPNLLSDIGAVLLRFRLHKYALQADIKSMYYRVLIPPDQWDMLRFLWVDDEGNIIHLRHTRHVFGGVWCSASSTYALRRIIDDTPDMHPIIKQVIEDMFYVDDCLPSVPTLRDLEVIALEMPAVIEEASGMGLRKIITNHPGVLAKVPAEVRAQEALEIYSEFKGKVLGIKWDVKRDVFYFTFNSEKLAGVINHTRRSMLSVASGIFDLPGLISPLVIPGKLLFQKATKLKLSWDESVPDAIAQPWRQWLSSLENLECLQVPRCIKPFNVEDGNVTLQIHTFADASLEAYAAVSYLRCEDLTSGEITCRLIKSKAKVAPIKPVTVPRLELQACLIAARLSNTILLDMKLNDIESHYWSDSKIALGYVQNSTKRYHMFVSNRVGEISTLTDTANWNHVTSQENPSDLATRSKIMKPGDLNKLWFEGPDWLKMPPCNWPSTDISDFSLDHDPEVKVVAHVATCSIAHPTPTLLQNVFDHYSSFYSMKRAVVILTRWVKFATKRPTDLVVPLTAKEMMTAEYALITLCQKNAFCDEIAQLTRKEEVNVSSPIASLYPFLDKNDVLRVGGRTGSHPVILPGKHPVARAIVQDAHSLAHLGLEWTLGIVRNKFWIVKGRPLVKGLIHDCVTCKKLHAKPMVQLMSDLPIERIVPGLPVFTYTGVDVYGPYVIRNYRSDVKRYGALFTCMTTRAVHIEILNSLDTSCLINAVCRFKCRRGQPLKYFSDNGTNLVAAEKELRVSFQVFSKDELIKYATKGGAEWSFIPPKAPHFGGAWERLIGVSKQVARGLKAACANTRLNDEILATLFTEVECIVNGRPLTKLSDDPNDFTPITPSNLLMMKQGANMPPGRFDSDDVYRKIWRHTQHLVNRFWRCWLRLYLPSLQTRCKWRVKRDGISKGDLVLLLDQTTPRHLWPLAIVEEVSVGRDGLVRSVLVRTRTTTFRRPITQVIMLEARTNDDPK